MKVDLEILSGLKFGGAAMTSYYVMVDLRLDS